jgi:hypothetical protein
MAASVFAETSEARSAAADGGELNQRRNNLNKTHSLFIMALLTVALNCTLLAV